MYIHTKTHFLLPINNFDKTVKMLLFSPRYCCPLGLSSKLGEEDVFVWYSEQNGSLFPVFTWLILHWANLLQVCSTLNYRFQIDSFQWIFDHRTFASVKRPPCPWGRSSITDIVELKAKYSSVVTLDMMYQLKATKYDYGLLYQMSHLRIFNFLCARENRIWIIRFGWFVKKGWFGWSGPVRSWRLISRQQDRALRTDRPDWTTLNRVIWFI